MATNNTKKKSVKKQSVWEPKVRVKKETKLIEVTRDEYSMENLTEWKGYPFLEKVSKYGKFYFKVKNV